MPLLLDLDGTLIDSEPLHKRSEIETFALWGLRLAPSDLRPFTGTTLPLMLGGVGEKYGVQVDPEEFMEAQIPAFRKIIRNELRMFPDAERLLARARNAGVRMALVTSSMPWYLEAVSERFPVLVEAFEARVCQADVADGKPHPEAFRTASQRLGVAPNLCTAVEDSVNGIVSARAAGCRAVGIDREGHGRLGAADEVVSSLDQLDLSGV